MTATPSTLDWLEWKAFVMFRELTRSQRKARNKEANRIFLERVEQLGPDDVVFDFGANYGLFTEKLAQSGATVHAFEPDPTTFEELRKRAGHFSNVVLHQAAIGGESGQIRLYRGIDKSKWTERRRSEAASVFSEGKDVDQDNYVSVPIYDIKSVIEDIPGRIAIIKMDVEGAEVPALERLLETSLLDRVDAIFVETHEHMFPSLYKRTQALRRIFSSYQGSYVNLNWR